MLRRLNVRRVLEGHTCPQVEVQGLIPHDSEEKGATANVVRKGGEGHAGELRSRDRCIPRSSVLYDNIRNDESVIGRYDKRGRVFGLSEAIIEEDHVVEDNSVLHESSPPVIRPTMVLFTLCILYYRRPR